MNKRINISLDWAGKFQFVGTNDTSNAKVLIDIDIPETEKKETGPKQLFLQGMASCTAGVLIYLLEKMRVEMPTKLKVDVSGKLTEDHPMYFDAIDVTYHIEGNTGVDAIRKVVEMSEKKYCGLTYMLEKVAKFNVKVLLNGENIELYS